MNVSGDGSIFHLFEWLKFKNEIDVKDCILYRGSIY